MDFEVQLTSQILSIRALELQLSIDGGSIVVDDERVFEKAVRDFAATVPQDIQLEFSGPLTERVATQAVGCGVVLDRVFYGGVCDT